MDNNRWTAFGDFTINLATGELRRNGRIVQMERQPARVLARLVAGEGQLVTRRELIQAVWPEHTHVDFDRGLNYCIRQVRVALGEQAGCVIETIPRQGYRLVGPPAAAAAPRGRRIVAAVAAAVLLTMLLETGPGSEHHHAIAVHLVTTAHNWLF